MAKLFEVGTKAQFDALKIKDNNIIYWITDTQELYRGNTLYAVGREATENTAGLMSAEDKKLLLSLNALVNNNVNTVDTGDYGVALASGNDYIAPMDILPTGGIEAFAAYDGWEADKEHYPWYDCYYDEAYSYIDANKNITLDKGQINITEESYAQFIPFEMKRYYDGVDLSKMTISIYYVTKDGYGANGEIVNMQYGTDAIRFAWLIDENVTHVAGDIKFEVNAYGIITDESKTLVRNYNWKSKTGSGINVTQALLTGNKIELDDSWMKKLIEDITISVVNQIADAQITEQVNQANEAVQKAEAAAARAEKAAEDAAGAADSSLGVLSDRVTKLEEDMPTKVSELENDAGYLTEHQSLEEYAKKTEIPEVPSKVSELENDSGYLTEHQSLEEYAKKTEIPTIPTDISAFNNDVGYLTEHQSLEGLASEEFVLEEIKKVDVSEQLKDYAKTSDLEGLASETWVEEQIAQADISEKLKEYATHEELQQAIESVDVSEQLKDYALIENVYDKTVIDNKDSAIQSGVDANTQKISNLSEVVTGLQEQMNNIDSGASQKYTYDVAYNDVENPDIGENVFVLYEIQNEGLENEVKEVKSKFTIVGGSGGGTSSNLKIEYITKTPVVATLTDKVELFYRFTGTDSSGDNVMEGDATWKVGGTVVATGTAVYGENSFDITNYLVLGTQKVVLSITDAAGSLVTKQWTVQKIDVRLESTFNDNLTYPIGPVNFDYTPYGAIAKSVHFILDGEEIAVVNTSSSGIPTAYSLPTQEHGAHLLEVYITAEVNGNLIESNHIYKDIIWYDENSSVPVIGTIYQDFEAMQYDATNIAYVVYDPTTESPVVTRAIDGVEVSTSVMVGNTDVWQYKTSEIGEHELTISCGETVKKLKATIKKLDIDVEPVTAGLVFDFNPAGKTNNDSDRLWKYDNGTNIISMSVSDNFDWVNGGYQIDENGDQYFCIKAGTSANIDYKLFEDDAKKNGKEFKFIFKSANVQSADANFLRCIDNTTEDNHIGIEMNVHEAYVYGQAGKLHLPYSEEDIIEFEFNISKDTEDIPMVMGYEDGVSTCPMVYTSSHNFTQNTPKIINLGSEKCDLHIYRFKVYNTSLDSRGILNNFIADARNAEEIISRYNRNQIYDENNQLTPEILAQKCPQLRIIQLEAPYFTNSKDEKVGGTTIRQIYKNGDPILDNWVATDCVHAGQGTSSNNYGASGRNLDLIMKTYKNYGNNPVITLGDGKTTVSKVSLTRNSIETNYFNVKVNIASSENANNALLQKRYNEFNPYERPFVREDESLIPKIKDTMEFYNCVVFIRENDTTQDAQGNYTTHREFNDTNWHFYAIGNIGDSKKTDDTRLTDPDDRYECINEIIDVEKPLSDFPVGEEALKILEAEGFDKEDFVVDGTTVESSYEWRYIWEDGTDEENEEVANYCKQKWIEMYQFVTQSTDEEFKAHLGDYFVLDSVMYYYLFTTRYTMVDNRAKNTFWHYGKTGEVDADGNPIRKWDLSFDYDNDTSLGINNYGDMVYRYGYEDTDVQDGTNTEVFRESDSTFFCRLRDNFGNEMKELYKTLESKNAWNASTLIGQFDTWQSEFPEELWRVDIDRKYIRTYNSSFINGAGDPQFLENMAHGKKKYQRRQYERDQEQYMASKYQTTLAFADSAVLRCEVPEGDLVIEPNYKFKLTPYNYMYLNVQYGNGSTPVQLRVEPNKEYEIPFEGKSADIVNIYSASMLKSLGDLSASYPATVSAPTADKLTVLTIGNKTEGYDNPKLTSVTLGANDLLEELNLANVSSFNQSLDLSALNNLKRLYAKGSGITGVAFADGGNLELAELPAVGSLSMKNLIYLRSLDIESYNKLTTMLIENCPNVDLLGLINSATSLSRIRLIGVDLRLEDDVLLDRLLNMSGIDGNGYNTKQSVLTGHVFIPVVKEKKMEEYNRAWPDLQVSYNTLIPQYVINFVNDDGTVLDTQYVNEGSYPVDPITREENPILIPTKESSVSTIYTYKAWDKEFTQAFSDKTYMATYSESVREYTVKYVSMNAVKETYVAPYGSVVHYQGEIPVYTGEEEAYRYYLFNRWDKSGYVDGDKTINAVFDTFKYSDGYFDNKDFSELTPVEIYGMIQMGIYQDYVVEGDTHDLQTGVDYEYDDIVSKVLIENKTDFNGTNYIDTKEKLFDYDKDFVLAIDFQLSSQCAAGGVLAECYADNGNRGFKLNYNTYAKLTWNTSAQSTIAKTNRREMLVLRHKKGDTNLYIYSSNAEKENSSQVNIITDGVIESSLTMDNDIKTSTLVFGCERTVDNFSENYAIGTIYWSKVWYVDLGEDACKAIASYPRENIGLKVGGFRRFYRSDATSTRTAITFIAQNALSNPLTYNVGGSNCSWKDTDMRSYLNGGFYNSLPVVWKQLFKQMNVKSTVGDKSSDIVEVGSYVTIPAASDMGISNSSGTDLTMSPYRDEISPANGPLPIFTDNASRVLTDENGNPISYWLRSPTVNGNAWIHIINYQGYLYPWQNPATYIDNSNNTTYIYIRPLLSI